MSTSPATRLSGAQLSYSADALSAAAPQLLARRPKAPAALCASLLALILYAAFAHGAAGSAANARVEVALSIVSALAAGAWLWSGTLRLRAPRLVYVALGLLGAFTAWNAFSVLWSVAPEQSWIEFNRVVGYLLVLCLAVGLGASHLHSVERIAGGFLAVVLLVTAYALGQKLLPGVHVDGLFNLNHTGSLPRLQEPFGYWNALGLFIAMGIPIGLALVVDRMRSPRSRLGHLLALELMFLALGFTYSRGAILALVIALAAGICLAQARLRALMWLALAGVASVPPLIVGLTVHALSDAGVGLARRESAGAILALVMIATLVALGLSGRKLLGLEHRIRVNSSQARQITRGLLAGGTACLIVGLLVVGLSPRGLDGTVSHAWKSFTAAPSAASSDPQHLLSVDSEHRWVWWNEAAGAFSDRPLTGWGAGSFPVVHLLYRRNRLTVNQPHSVPLQWLAENGLIGAVPAICAFVLLLLVGVRTVRRWALSSDRLLGAALLAAAIAYGVHALYDWDWDIPGVSIPAFVLLGVLVGSARREPAVAVPAHSAGARALALAGLTLGLGVFALSAALPSLAASKASDALLAADGGTVGSLAGAQSSAALAARLDPLSDAGSKGLATIALRRSQLATARSYLLDATSREPTDLQAWQTLLAVDEVLGDSAGARLAVNRIVGLDPHQASQVLSLLVGHANLLQATPKQSATATPTPMG